MEFIFLYSFVLLITLYYPFHALKPKPIIKNTYNNATEPDQNNLQVLPVPPAGQGVAFYWRNTRLEYQSMSKQGQRIEKFISDRMKKKKKNSCKLFKTRILEKTWCFYAKQRETGFNFPMTTSFTGVGCLDLFSSSLQILIKG